MQIVGSKLVERNGHQFFWQICVDGQHRLVLGDVEGEWAKFTAEAVLSVEDKTYAASTWDREEGHVFSAKDLMRVVSKAKVAHINVAAFHAETMEPIINHLGEPIVSNLETITDIPAAALGDITHYTMQKAWKTGVDGTQIVLRVTFS